MKELVKIVKIPLGKAVKCHAMQLMNCKNGKSVVDCCLEHLNYEANKVCSAFKLKVAIVVVSFALHWP